jgi:assimilatory nitrate reductase catalytic subunit
VRTGDAMAEGAASAAVRSTCPYCGVGCGVVAEIDGAGGISVRGDPEHPANRGRLCSKGSALADTLGLEGRLLHPEIHGRRVSWDTALDGVAAAFRRTIAEHGPDSVAFYVSGQLLTEDYYVANKLMKGFIGSANIDTNSRLCMASSVAGHRRAFGADVVPGCYDDLEEADLVVLVGSNLAWCHPILHQRLTAAREARPEMRVVAIDPRRTATAETADLHLAISADGDVALFAGLLVHLAHVGALDRRFVARATAGIDAALAAAAGLDEAAIAAATGLALGDIARFYDLFAATEKVVTVYSQGVNQSVSGTDKVNAIINCHLATGRIGRPGMGPFSVTGQPNAMGGREVGGLSNQLAAHMELECPADRALVQRFWGAPRIAERPGLKAVDLFRAVADGRIKALWIMATNPVDSLPEADLVRAALEACPFVVVSDVVRRTDTAAVADVLLPAAAWGEKDGTVTNSERRISRQRAFRPLPGEARPDWWIVAAVAGRMGFGEAFAYPGPAEIFAEHATLTALGNDGRRALDLGGVADLAPEAYAALGPLQWPVRRGEAMGPAAAKRFYGNGRFHTPDGRARFVPTPPPAAAPPSGEFPFVLNTGRVRDQWHTMTRTGLSARLARHIAEPFAEIHPDDAAACGIAPASLVTVESAHGRLVVRALVSDRQRRGSVFVPMHWTDVYASRARVDALVPAATDPVSGQPGSKRTPVRIAPFAAAWYGFAVTAGRPDLDGIDYWALAPADGGFRVELAGTAAPLDWTTLAKRLLGVAHRDDESLLAYHDGTSGRHRFAAFDGERLVGALFAAPEPVMASRAFAVAQLGAVHPTAGERFKVLAGRGGTAAPERGAIVCSCFDVGVNDIVAAVTTGGCMSVAAVGAALKAGTNCGSCRSEIKRLLDDVRVPQAG